jgi:two-component system OmpR family response regulator
VLVVDDDPAIRLLCSVNLELAGLTVLEAADGRIALARARSEQPDVVVTDVRMPQLDGFQLAEALQGDDGTRAIPLIFVSAETNAANQARAGRLGALAYLTKPFDPSALVAIVGDALSRAGLHVRPEATEVVL